MNNAVQFADVLNQYVGRSGYSPSQLARLSGIPKTTLITWLHRRVKKPHEWRDLVRLAAVLHLDEAEATSLLQAAGHPSLGDLLSQAGEASDRDLLSPWREAVRQALEIAPFQAIADLPYFVGRERELENLKEALISNYHAAIFSLEGMGGVGKTSLAARLAYQLRSHFPDGVLWARLDTSSPMSILSTFAVAYGQDVSEYPDLDSRGRVVRQLLAGKRALIVLDNVRSSREVVPLLPPSGSCAVLITTRRHDLSVTRGAHRFKLGPFSREKREALALFARILSLRRIQEEEAILAEIADVLGHLPLAIAITASRLAYEPGWTAAEFLQRVRQEQGRLNELAYEDQSVRLSFSLSYEALAPAVQQFFASLGAFGGQDFSVEAVAYVNDVPYTEAKDGLRTLYGLSLVQQGEAGRYSLHPLLCDYARPKMDGNVPLERMIEYFVRYAETHQMDYEALEGERDNLLAALEAAFERGQSRLLVRGINAFYHFLDTRGLYDLADLHLARAQEATRSMTPSSGLETVLLHRGQLARHRGNYPQAEALLQEGLGVARQNGDPERISALLNRLGVVESFLGDYAQAAAHMEEGLALARQTGDRQRIIFFLISLGGGAVERGYYSQAEAHFQEGLSLAREIGHQEGTATLLNNLGDVAIRRGDYAQAEAYLKESLDVARQIGHQRIIAVLYDNLGEVALMRGEYARAQVYLRDGLALARQILDQEITCHLLKNLGALAMKRGDAAQAESYLEQGLALARQIGHPWLIGNLLNVWGNLCLEQEKPDLADNAFREALDKTQEPVCREAAATALYGLARIAAARGDLAGARRQARESLGRFEAMGDHRKAEVARWLQSLPAS